MRFRTCLAIVLSWVGVGSTLRASVPQPARPPNIVVIAVDTLRCDHLSCYGYKRATSPNIDQLAAEGVLFEQTYSTASWTLPSFVSIFTGLYPAAHGTTMSPQPIAKKIRTLPERLAEKGYYCGGVVSNPTLYGKFGFARGFARYDDYSIFLNAELAILSANQDQDRGRVNDVVTGSLVTLQAKRLIEQAKQSGKPVFLFVHYFDPHDSYIPPPPFNQKFVSDYRGSMNGRGIDSMKDRPPSGADLQHLIDLYDGEIAYNDQEIGLLTKEIDRVLDPQQTLVIFVADHGVAFGEHGKLQHGNSVYAEEVRVPMIWRWQGVLPKERRVSAPVMNFDLFMTIAQLTRLDQIEGLQSASLWEGLTGGELPSQRFIYSDRAIEPVGQETKSLVYHVACTRGSLRLHARFGTSPAMENAAFELYDLASDPTEQHDLASNKPAEFAPMRGFILQTFAECAQLRRARRNSDDDKPTILTEKERRRLDGLGYVTQTNGN